MNAPPLAFELPLPGIAAWRAGNTGAEGVWHFESGQPGRHVLISALIHGNEICGAWALKGLLEAAIRPQRGALTLMFCNLAAFDTFDAARPDAARFVDEDLNRQWSPARLQSGSSLERRRAAELRPFVERADWLLDLHSMHEPSAPLLLTGVQPRNLDLARQLRAPEHIVIDVGHSDGVRMRDFGRFGLPDDAAGDTRSLLIECGFHGDPSSRAVAQDMCLRFLQAAGTLDGSAPDAQLPGWRLPDAPSTFNAHWRGRGAQRALCVRRAVHGAGGVGTRRHRDRPPRRARRRRAGRHAVRRLRAGHALGAAGARRRDRGALCAAGAGVAGGKLNRIRLWRLSNKREQLFY